MGSSQSFARVLRVLVHVPVVYIVHVPHEEFRMNLRNDLSGLITTIFNFRFRRGGSSSQHWKTMIGDLAATKTIQLVH
jgi:hypothetical protein